MSPAKKLQTLEQEDLDRLLLWLDSDPERAGLIYEKIRPGLITILASRHCSIPEELGDETMDRAARRIEDIREIYVGKRAFYFLGVMNNVHHKSLKKPPPPQPPIHDEDEVATKEATHL